MAGIYLHIPFCKKACHYCDFHFSTSPAYKDQMVKALRSELILRKPYLGNELIETIYFGGGTPSVLSVDDLSMLIHTITENYEVSASAEITLEANPDDLIPQKVKEFRQTPVNRFSIGIQSFFEEDLKWMNRAHNASEGLSSIKRVQDAGFENITADLIYGYPLLSDEKWMFNIRELIDLQIPHISSYSMTVEPATALASFIQKGKQKAMDEGQSARQFEILMDELQGADFEHYEISNFAKPGSRSKHNSNYWEGVNYMGIGPSAHSFNGDSRQWNVADNMKYIQSMEQNKVPFEIEHLTTENRINEYIMTALRTSKGIDLSFVSQRYHSDYSLQIRNSLEPFLDKEWAILTNQTVTLSKQGKLFADHIASELFVELL
ncbi:radical SAM family heme chaperone HemW [Daejeonella lutea]|uniref:Heme chaperone HemW n=1 Tax=Daejeonella lutea TaxID=572036 RepID=A0A1T5CZX6_9SPHI|nr:radical SAM family heme chaperone HemW [Daejeonella lutea]SKB64913.1 oxygen-independent coproporphyrinogen-3 oxidase [Daejeonella lutea]